MELPITLTEEAGHVPLWPWEEPEASRADYVRALERLHRFVEEIEVKHLQTLEDLSIRLPADQDITIGQQPNVGNDSLYVIDLRGASRDYHPVKEPHVPETQQGFAELLKDALCVFIEGIAGLS